MNRKLMVCFLVLFFCLGLIVTGLLGKNAVAQKETATAEEASAGEEVQEFDIIILNKEGYKRDRKGPVKFTHFKHSFDYGVSCWDCHHEYEDDSQKNPNIWRPWGETDTCDTCHDPQEIDVTSIRLQRAFHLNCKGCHKALAKEKKRAGEYRKCTGCHERKK
ncbi:MAG: cytochrome c3 family protein [Deltaproteobacteria bacterium]|nr:cytochrome c3 family protein [Deltaproteobacteria bacterium]